MRRNEPPPDLSRKRSLGAWRAPLVLFIAYAIALVLLAGSAVIDARNARLLDESNARVARTLEALEKLRQTSNTTFVAESSQLGFLIAGKESYLEPYRQMQERLELRLSELGGLLNDAPGQQVELARLRELARTRFAQMDRTLAAYREGGLEKARETASDDGGEATMIEIRTAVRTLLENEGKVLAERRASASDAYSLTQFRSLLATVVVGLALTVFYLLMVRFLRQRDDAIAKVQNSNVHLEGRVKQRTAELSDLSRHLLNVREDEKKSIARDLHDEFGSYLTAINMDVSRTRDKISESNPEQAAKLERTIGMLGHTIEMKRRLISDLRPSILDNLGLGAALEQYIDEWSRHADIKATFDYSGDLDGCAEGCPIAIFRVFQEALINVVKHAKATEVTAWVHRVGDSIELEIADNGVGILETAPGKHGTHGLIGIRERVLAYQGRLEISRRAEGGTALHAWLPCQLSPLTDERTQDLGSYA